MPPRKTRLITAMLGAVLAMSLAACGSESSGTNGGGGSTAEPARSPSSSMTSLAAAAAKEGALTWYTTFADSDIQPVLAAFNKQYPAVKVKYLRLSADKLPARISTEQKGGKYVADVVEGDSPQIAQLIKAGALQPYDPPDNPPLPAGLKLPEGYQTVVYALTTVIAYNPAALKQKGMTAPTSWQDLTKSEWKGQFSVDPYAVNWYDGLVTSMGHDAALQLIKNLGKNSPRLVESHTQALTQVQSGEPVAAATAYAYKAAQFKADSPDTIDFFNSNPLPTSLNLIDVVKNAPHPNAAKLFVDWVISQQGQKAIEDLTTHTSLRSDVDNDPTVWDPNKWTPAWGDPNMSPDTYNSYIDEMKAAFGAQ